MFVEVYFARG